MQLGQNIHIHIPAPPPSGVSSACSSSAPSAPPPWSFCIFYTCTSALHLRCHVLSNLAAAPQLRDDGLTRRKEKIERITCCLSFFICSVLNVEYYIWPDACCMVSYASCAGHIVYCLVPIVCCIWPITRCIKHVYHFLHRIFNIV